MDTCLIQFIAAIHASSRRRVCRRRIKIVRPTVRDGSRANRKCGPPLVVARPAKKVEYSSGLPPPIKATMFLHAILLLATLAFANPAALAAPDCPVSIIPPKAPENVVDWYDKYVAPSRALAVTPENPRLTKTQAEAFIDGIKGFHRRGVSDSLFFEPLVQQIMAKYSDAGDFRGLSSVAAQNIYRPGSGPDLDFSAMCIDIRRSRFPEDTFALTLFGVSIDNCQHVTVRGLVFTNTLVNGAVNGQCRPDHIFYRMLIVPVFAGTNTVTFVCNKDVGGCAGR